MNNIKYYKDGAVRVVKINQGANMYSTEALASMAQADTVMAKNGWSRTRTHFQRTQTVATRRHLATMRWHAQHPGQCR